MTTLALRPPAWAALFCAAGIALASPATAQNSTTVQVPKLALTDFTLPNGLRVILSENHSSPIVACEVWYNAGSKFDPKGKTGIAHMFEHMMDEGSVHMPNGEYKRVIQSAGGTYNAATQNDWAQYWSVVPSNQLETVLWLEAERMANLAPAPDRFALERDAVKNEYRTRIQNSAPQSGAVALFETLFPEGAYAPPLYGYPEDLASITLDDMRAFYEKFYVPNNAVLVLVGDFNAADARRKVEKHFSPIPRGKPVQFPVAATPFHGEKRIVVEHPNGDRGLWVAWRGAKSAEPDRAAVIALSSILNQRLRRILVDDRRAAIVINPGTNQNFDLQESAVFQVAMTPNATASATMFEEVMDSVVASIKKDGVTATELNRFMAGFRMDLLSEMQSDQSVATNLGDATLNQKNPLGTYQLLDRGQRLTPADVQAAARKYLTGDRVVLSIVPSGKLDLISKPNLPYTNMSRKTP
jgi:zinc protease